MVVTNNDDTTKQDILDQLDIASNKFATWPTWKKNVRVTKYSNVKDDK